VPVVFDNAGLVMELLLYESIPPGFGWLINAADSVVPYRVIPGWSARSQSRPSRAEQQRPTLGYPNRMDRDRRRRAIKPRSVCCREGRDADVARRARTLRGLQLPAVLHEPLPAFPVQVEVHVCACVRLSPVTATATKAPAR
jgi:hypothetical protein